MTTGTGKVAEVKPEVSREDTKITQTGDAVLAQTLEVPLKLNVPETARIPDGATFYEGTDDGRCRVIKQDGERCNGIRARATGLCPGHAGTTPDIRQYSALGHEARRRKASARAVLGITSRRASTPLQAARVAAQIRADDYARALVDAPLDDPELGSVARQQAAVRALELLYPQVTGRLEVELPTEPDEVAGMGWQEMQELASSLLHSTEQ